MTVEGLGDVLTEANLRLLLAGMGSAALAVAAIGWVRRPVPAWATGVAAPALALFVVGWWDWPDPEAPRLVAAVAAGLAAGHGSGRLAGRQHGTLVLLTGAAGVLLGVPETAPAVVVIGTLAFLLVQPPGRAAGYGLGLAVAASALLGASSTGWSFVGGVVALGPACALGVAPLVRRITPRQVRGIVPGRPWFALGSLGVAVAAARWIGVAPDATWGRVAVLAACSAALVGLTAPAGQRGG